MKWRRILPGGDKTESQNGVWQSIGQPIFDASHQTESVLYSSEAMRSTPEGHTYRRKAVDEAFFKFWRSIWQGLKKS